MYRFHRSVVFGVLLVWMLLLSGGCRPPFAKVEAVVDEGIDFDWSGQLRIGRVGGDTGQVLPINVDDEALSFVVTSAEEKSLYVPAKPPAKSPSQNENSGASPFSVVFCDRMNSFIER